MLCSITPLLRVKVPPRSPYGLKPLISCIASPTNQRTDLFCEFGSFFFSFSPFSNLFGHVFWLFLTPLYAYMFVKGLHLDLNSEFYHLSLESENKAQQANDASKDILSTLSTSSTFSTINVGQPR